MKGSMQTQTNRFGYLDDTQKMEYVKKIIGYFHDQREEEIGIIAAQDMLDFFLFLIGDDVYKKAVKDCKKIVEQKYIDTTIELDSITGL